MTRTREYKSYLGSRAWKLFRIQSLLRAQFHCERCGTPALCGTKLEVHHKHYETLGKERPDDVEVLCERCHKGADDQRVASTIWWARLDGWASRMYGADWQYTRSTSEVEGEFELWLSEREDDE